MQQQGGVAGVRDLADFFGVSEAVVRDYAYENDVAKVGNAIVFQVDDAEGLEEELAEADDETDCDDEPEDEDEPEDD